MIFRGKVKLASFTKHEFLSNLYEDVLAAPGVVPADTVSDDVDVVKESFVVVRPLSNGRQALDEHLNLGHFEVACGWSLARIRCGGEQMRQHSYMYFCWPGMVRL